jgi:hypothetical protein
MLAEINGLRCWLDERRCWHDGLQCATMCRNVRSLVQDVGYVDLQRSSLYKSVRCWGRCVMMFDDSEASHFGITIVPGA